MNETHIATHLLKLAKVLVSSRSITAVGLTQKLENLNKRAKEHGFSLAEDGSVQFYRFNPNGTYNLMAPPMNIPDLDTAKRQSEHTMDELEGKVEKHKRLLENIAHIGVLVAAGEIDKAKPVQTMVKSGIAKKATDEDRLTMNKLLEALSVVNLTDEKALKDARSDATFQCEKLVEKWTKQMARFKDRRHFLMSVINAVGKGTINDQNIDTALKAF